MKITFLGTGTSQGVPIINCDCAVCQSDNPKNKRMRCSIMIEINGQHLLVDTSMDMRNQFIEFRFPKIDAVLFTHAHADHIFGLDELRRFNYIQKQIIPVYGHEETISRIKDIFGYAFTTGEFKPGIPNISADMVDDVFEIGETKIEPVPLFHGSDTVYGYRIGNFAYCTDVNWIPDESKAKLHGLDVLVLDALRERFHPKHFSLKEAISTAEELGAKTTYFTHMSHILDHEKHGKQLPGNCHFAYDGLVIEV